MKRRVVSMLLILTFTLAVTGCGQTETPTANSAQPTQSAAIAQPSTEPQETIVATNTPEASAAPSLETSAAPASSANIADAIDAATTAEDAAAKLNQWVKTSHYATEDETYHTVYVRVTKVTTQTDDAEYVQAAIDLHNENSYEFSQIDVSEVKIPSDAELCVLDYEVYVPEEFPSPEYGITAPDFNFSASNIGGGGIPSADGASTYIGMGSMDGLNTEKEPKYEVGNTYAFRSLFMMVKGYEDYVLEYTAYPDGTKETSADVMYHAYHQPR